VLLLGGLGLSLFWSCDQASNHVSASLLLQEIDVNLIITDYCMPGMTGYDLLRRVKVRFAHGLKFLSRPCSGLHKLIMVHTRVKFSSLLADFGIQGSSSLKDIPVVIMSSENVPARINR